MSTSLLYIANFIRNRSAKSNKINDVKQLQDFGQVAQIFISSIYEAGQDVLEIDKNNMTFKQSIFFKFTPKIKVNKPVKWVEQLKDKQVKIVKLPPPILARLLKKILEKSKFFKKSNTTKKNTKPKKQSYAQALAPNVSEILKLKENFLNLSAKKIKNIYRTINDSGKVRSKINMTTKRSSRKYCAFLNINLI